MLPKSDPNFKAQHLLTTGSTSPPIQQIMNLIGSSWGQSSGRIQSAVARMLGYPGPPLRIGEGNSSTSEE